MSEARKIGWHPDPEREGWERYWSGGLWIDARPQHRRRPRVSSGPAARPRGKPSPLARAWISIALVPVFVGLASAVLTASDAFGWGIDPGTGRASILVDAALLALAVAVVLIPCVGAGVYGRRAVASGVYWAWGALPGVIGFLASAATMLLALGMFVMRHSTF